MKILFLFQGLLGALLVTHAASTRVTCDQEAELLCGRRLPQCLEYEYEPDPVNQGKFILRCLVCQEGLVPYWTHNNVTVNQTGMPDRTIFTCGPNSDNKPVSCTSESCFSGPLKGCLKYTVESPQMDRPGVFDGRFKCLECFYQYEPTPEGIVLRYDATLGQDRVPVNVCRRRVGIFDCGIICQLEFPGCSRYQVSKLRGGSETGQTEFANFKCLESKPGYIINHQVVEASTMFGEPKQVTIPTYTSGLVDCDTRMCQSVLPNCEQYYTVAGEFGNERVFCNRCKSSKIPIPYGAYSREFIFVYMSSTRTMVCEIGR